MTDKLFARLMGTVIGRITWTVLVVLYCGSMITLFTWVALLNSGLPLMAAIISGILLATLATMLLVLLFIVFTSLIEWIIKG